jgi:hypothetical protein
MIISIIAFHIFMLLTAAVVLTGIAPTERVGRFLGYVHNIIGITAPAAEQVRMIGVIWIASVMLVVDGCLVLLVVITKFSTSG